MVVTIEPHLLRAWTCCEPPTDQLHFAIHELPTSQLARSDCLSQRAAQALHWVNLVSGQFFKENAPRFRRDQRADQLLLENLRSVRSALREAGLKDDDVCHDLLARVIFIQFLFDRKDSSGKAALNPSTLERLHDEDVLKAKHGGFASILADYDETYRLFRWLNERFNGDLFPGKGDSADDRERAWQAEKRHVKAPHLDVLAQFVSGKLDMPEGQRCLWREYAFDAIPLEFISSIYEAFVTERARSEGIYYTPPHLVDFTLDRVLPWGGDGWDLKVLDPACGSGIFLVKAFQRLIHRWKKAHPQEDIRAETLRRLLENNLFGVDKDPHAVRVASFSLYLAMCDEIDPKHYWTQVRFPAMRDRRLINADFFEEQLDGFRTVQDAESYDLVVGNAPWGEELLTKAAKAWAGDPNHRWPVANKGIGTLFLPKAAALTKPEGKVAMVQSASSLLFNRSRPAQKFRKQFFSTFRVVEAVNLSALRFKVFSQKRGFAKEPVAPACVITFCPTPPTDEKFFYLSPKLTEDIKDDFELVIEPQDEKRLHPSDGADDPQVWSAMMWGRQRDWTLVRRLRDLPNLARLKLKNVIEVREGLIPSAKGKLHKGTVKRRFWAGDSLPHGSFLFLDASAVPTTEGLNTHRQTSLRAFEHPQLVVKQSWQESAGRFCAALTRTSESKGVLVTQSYLSAHASPEDTPWLESACLSYNSILAVFFLLLTSSRFASYRPEPLVKELLDVPIPTPSERMLDGLSSEADVDARAFKAFGLKDAEWVLVEDLFNFTLPDFKGNESSPGRQRTCRRSGSHEEPELSRYCEYFTRVLKAGFGGDKAITATVFQEKGKDLLPFRLVAFQLGQPAKQALQVERLDLPDLVAELETLNRTWLKTRTGKAGSVYHQRVARIYDHRGKVPTVFLIKPDACRYWTRSMGLHDADEVAADFVRWQSFSAGSSELQGTPA
ncbi:MAG: N-6 DNA methylase [Verrucomicrobiota bacterium]